jgi:hypothetical protein
MSRAPSARSFRPIEKSASASRQERPSTSGAGSRYSASRNEESLRSRAVNSDHFAASLRE